MFSSSEFSSTTNVGNIFEVSLQSAYSSLITASQSQGFLQKIAPIFGGGSEDLSKLQELVNSWSAGDFRQLPNFKILPSSSLNGANGAFSGAEHTIYLSLGYLSQGLNNADILTGATQTILEEIGHFVDTVVNPKADSPGDEGALFAATLMEKHLSDAERQQIQQEDDHGFVTIEGRNIPVEQSVTPFITVTSPNGGEIFQAGSSYNLTWTDNISENVKIDLYKGSVSVYQSTLLSSTLSDGSETITLPNNLSAGTDYRIKISSVSNSSLFDFSDQTFTIYQGVVPQWIKSFGTTTYEGLNKSLVDSSGNTYMVGTTLGNLVGTNAGGYDIWLTKYDTNGNQLWLRQFGTSGNDAANLALDSSGNIYLTGSTLGNLGGTNAGGYDAWLSKYDNNGNQLWLRQFGTSGYDSANGLALDSSGNVYLTGNTTGNLGGTNAGSGDVWVGKYDTNGNQLWLKQFGSSLDDSAYFLTLGSNGNIYLAGSTTGNLGGSPGNLWVGKYDINGNQQWLRQFGHDDLNKLAIDSSGNAYLTGRTYYKVGGTRSSEYDIWLTKYDTNGGQQWVKQFGSSGDDQVNDLVLDRNGNVYLTGYTNGKLVVTNAGISDAWLTKYDTNGGQQWLKQFGSSGFDIPYDLALDNNNNIYLAGSTSGVLGEINAGAGTSDIWLGKYDINGNQTWLRQFGSVGWDAAYTVDLDSSSNIYLTGTTSGGRLGGIYSIDNIWLAKYTQNSTYDGSSVISVVATDPNAAETATGVTPNSGLFTLTRTGPVTSALTVNLTLTGTATNGTDYTSIPSTATFAAGSSTAIVNVNPIDDTLVEGDETAILTLTAGTNYTLGTATTATVTIADNDFPVISVVATDPNAAETATGVAANPGLFTLTRTGPVTSALTVNLTLTGTATNGTDYTSIPSTATFAAGSATTTVNINPIDDTLVEGDETAILTLTAGTNYTLGTATTATVTIADNDFAPTITIIATDPNAAETVSGQTANPGQFTVTRTGDLSNSLMVNYTIGGTATQAIDYNNLSAIVTFAAGSSTATIDINPIYDNITEGNETVVLTLASGSTYIIGTSNNATVTIADFVIPVNSFQAEYFNNISLSGNPVLNRIENNINYDWGAGSPGNGIGNDNFSARWTGVFNFDAGSYSFHASVDDGMRIYVDGNLIHNTWTSRTQGTEYTTPPVSLSKGDHKIQVEYYEAGGLAIAKVNWINANNPSSIFNRVSAVNYAQTYTNTRNPQYHDYSYEGGNCANFVSQCLIAGGVLSTSHINANELTNYLLQGKAQQVSSVSNLQAGDVIAYSWDGGPIMDHVALYIGNNQVASNTADGIWPWNMGGAPLYKFLKIIV